MKHALSGFLAGTTFSFNGEERNEIDEQIVGLSESEWEDDGDELLGSLRREPKSYPIMEKKERLEKCDGSGHSENAGRADPCSF